LSFDCIGCPAFPPTPGRFRTAEFVDGEAAQAEVKKAA